ncbi:hypothetical protein BGZ68_008786 [Mortierella alpina]|nr:hypothetical protein BGZ68_008786 [Mortierella alpina]
MSQLAAAKVFEIPEVAILVIGQLERSHLVACAQVHRAWHEVIIPFLYHSVTLDEHFGLRSPDEVCWDGFQRYSSYMRVLEVDSRAVRDLSHFGFMCTNLTDLRLKLSGDTSKNALWAWGLLTLISNNPSISSLHLTSHGGSRLNELDRHLVVLRLLRYMSGLKKLVIAGKSMGQSSVDEIMRCAYRLEELDVALDRIDRDPIPRPSQPRIGFDLDSHLADLCLKDIDDGVDTQDASCLLDFAGRRCRRGTSLKKLRFVSQDRPQRGVDTVDASVLVGLGCSADFIHLSFMGITQASAMKILHAQVGHPAWCLKHLHIGPLQGVSHLILVKILGATTSSLVSLYLWETVLTDELLSVVLQNHGKSLQRVTVNGTVQVDVWKHLDMMTKGRKDHIRFVTNLD